MKSLLLFLCLAVITAQAQPVFRAGVSAIDITPTTFPRIIAGGFLEGRGEKVTDRLHVRSFVLDDGKMKIAFAIVDTCMMEQSLIDEAKALASKQCGIPMERMMVSATHTHSAPAAMGCLGTRKDTEYGKLLTPKIAEAIVAADKALQPARIGWGSFDDWEHTHNRRWIRLPGKEVIDPFGQPTGRANMHPGYLSKDVVGPSGPVDPQLSVISLQTAEGKPLGVLANYSQHYFGSSPISSDYYGLFCKHLAAKMGQSGDGIGSFVCAMCQGTSGDQMWMDYGAEKKNITIDTYASAVADSAMKALQTVKYLDHAPLGMVEKTLELNYRVPDEKRLAWARPIAAKIENDLPKNKEEVYAREALILHERQKTSVKLQAIRIGDLSIATLPNEVYAITGLKLKAQSPLPRTINIELANGAEGYIPPPEQHVLGGYTTWPARTAGLEVQAEPKMVESLLDALEEITGKNRQIITHTLGAYPQAVFASNPTSYWRMDEIAGDSLYPVNDWRGEEPRYEPGVARYLEGPQGEAFSGKGINRAPHFAGGRVDGFAMTGTDYSVEFWFWNALPTESRAVTGYLFSRGSDGDKACPGDHLGIGGTHADAQPGCLFVYNGNAAKGLISGKTKLAFKQWHHVVLSRTGKRLSVLLDGKPEIEGELDITHTTKDQWFIGGRSDNLFNFEGKIDEAAFYDRALSVDEAAAHYKASGMTPPAPAKLQTATPPLSPEESAKKWHVREGYRIELVAAEPVVLDPVAFDWDEKGRLWVIEMADYPLGMDGNGKAGGRVVMLEDTNADGRYDKRTVIVNDLSYPTGILTWRDGVIVTAAPDIFFIKPNGEKQVLFTGFSTGNQQLRVNGLRWGMDGWVYCAAGAHNSGYNKGTQIESKLTGQKIDLGSRDFRFQPDTGDFDPQSGPSQFGRARDDWGQWFGVQNSFPLWHYVLQDHYLRRNPHVIPPDPIHQLFPRNPPVYPASSMEKRFHSFDQSGRFTSACGIEVYRDRVLFDDGKTHAFTCEPFHNVVQHHVLEDDGVTFKAARDPAESKMDFLASEDRWCRPVMVRTGPDGALWVADMYRYMIEHPQWLPQNGKDELLPHYREGDDKGRIWRIIRSPEPPKGGITEQNLSSSNGWQRDKAQMQALWQKPEEKAWVAIHHASQSKIPQVRAQAAWTLHLLDKLSPEQLHLILLDENDEVVAQGLQIAEGKRFEGIEEPLLLLVSGKRFSHPRIRMQLALSAGSWKGDWPADIVGTVLDEATSGSPLAGAALSSALPHLQRICQQFGKPEYKAPKGVIGMLFHCALETKNEEAIAALVSEMKDKEKFAELLTVLDEKGLSLAEFSKQVTSAEAQQGLKKMATMLAQAVETVKIAKTAPPMAELALLASDREHREMVKSLLPELWQKSQSTEVLRLVTKLQPQGGPEFLLAGWNERTPVVRGQIIEALLSSDTWTVAVLKRHEAKACDAATRARLTKHPKKEIAKLASAAFADSTSATRAAVVEKFKPALKLTGDATKGKAAFAQVCISCHKLDGVGLELGPDLRSVVQHDAEKLLNSILDPSAIIEPGFTAYHCTLKNGEQLYGVIATETSASLTLKMAGNLTKSVLRSEIASLQSTGTSLMPEGLEVALTPQSLADLIAYLKGVK
ncbi:neutral/alkaline non-lysosomal ceramidase N-terminal domain-containing protein [Prosthecobacter sp.]|uniref:neutral/alkaline non-lysosomal ceramidase N-terminal domain-containing protein n=1 Tax=Prosthecobacter sp. TaxID=1965333 RepID=UPI0024873DAB|nr:neutral/alkaline non-lysosomal ceramidase N-terminal domain-containing protein [Prosthecobacter sp.]MDI1313561.1 neutral/alkaline non-lysosomal ceramidase N-terminal domain-containing protein [Prosthecobacter sp.]